MNKFINSIFERMYKHSLLPNYELMRDELNALTNFNYEIFYASKVTNNIKQHCYTFKNNTETIVVVFNLNNKGYVASIECM